MRRTLEIVGTSAQLADLKLELDENHEVLVQDLAIVLTADETAPAVTYALSSYEREGGDST